MVRRVAIGGLDWFLYEVAEENAEETLTPLSRGTDETQRLRSNARAARASFRSRLLT